MEKQKQGNKSSKKDNEMTFDNLIPQVVEMEEVLLGTLLSESNAYSLVCNILCAETFYKCGHKYIYNAIEELVNNQQPVDIITVNKQLKKKGWLDMAGGQDYLAQLVNKIASDEQIQYYAYVISQKYKVRQLLQLSNDIKLKALDESKDIEELISDIRKRLSDISSLKVERECVQINSVIQEAYEMLQKASARTDGLSGLASGFHALDRMTSGWQNGDLIVIGARPAMGKTAFAISMLKNIAVNSKIPVAFFSLEMNNVQLINRLIVNVCEIPGEKIKNGQLAPYEWGQLDYKIKDLYDAPLYIDDTPLCKIDELCQKAKYLVCEKGVKLIVIDYIQLLYNQVKYSDSRYNELNYFTRRLKSLAKELNIPIIVMSQLNRTVESREGIDGKRPQLTDLRDSGTICDDCDMVLFLHRPEYYKIYQDEKGNDLRGMAEIIIAKHRNGTVGEVQLRFRGDFTRFQNPEDDIIIPFPEGPSPF